MAVTARVGAAFCEGPSPSGDDRTLGLVGFSIFPHLDYPGFDENTMAAAETWAAALGNPAYAIEDTCAVRVVDGRADVVGSGNWRYFDEQG